MKKILTLLLFVCVTIVANAQIGATIVTNPEQNVFNKLLGQQMVKDIGEAVKQTAELEKQYTLLEKTKNALEVVNKHFSELNELANIILLTKNTVKTTNRVITVIRDFPHVPLEYKTRYVAICFKYLKKITDNTIGSKLILKDYGFKMNDSERLNAIKAKLEELEQININIMRIERKVESLNYKISMLKDFKKWN